MKIIALFLLIFLAGCTAPKKFLLGNTQANLNKKEIQYTIGIKNIEVPEYLKSKDIPYLTKDNQLKYFKDKKWAIYFDDYLTNRVISTLQKAFHTPNVFNYPLNSPKKPNLIIQITINKFIPDNKYIALDATFNIINNQQIKSKLFSYKQKIISKDKIIQELNLAFSKLEDDLINFIINY